MPAYSPCQIEKITLLLLRSCEMCDLEGNAYILTRTTWFRLKARRDLNELDTDIPKNNKRTCSGEYLNVYDKRMVVIMQTHNDDARVLMVSFT